MVLQANGLPHTCAAKSLTDFHHPFVAGYVAVKRPPGGLIKFGMRPNFRYEAGRWPAIGLRGSFPGALPRAGMRDAFGVALTQADQNVQSPAQVSNLLYRRLPVGCAWCVVALADWKSATSPELSGYTGWGTCATSAWLAPAAVSGSPSAVPEGWSWGVGGTCCPP
jgi:hypothetical protein